MSFTVWIIKRVWIILVKVTTWLTKCVCKQVFINFLLICNDIDINPGLVCKLNCSVCNKYIQRNQHQTMLDVYANFTETVSIILLLRRILLERERNQTQMSGFVWDVSFHFTIEETIGLKWLKRITMVHLMLEVCWIKFMSSDCLSRIIKLMF